MGDDPSVLLHRGDDQLGVAPAIEPTRSVAGNALQRPGQLGLLETRAGSQWLTAGVEDLEGPGQLRVVALAKALDLVVQCHEAVVQGCVDLESTGQLQRRCHQVGPGQLTEALMGIPQPAHAAGDSCRQHTHHRTIGRLAVGIQVHVSRGGPGCLLPEVQARHGAVGLAQDHEPAPADVAGPWVGHRQGEGGGHGGVDGVAAVPQNFNANIRGMTVSAHDHALGGPDRRRVQIEAPCPCSVGFRPGTGRRRQDQQQQ